MRVPLLKKTSRSVPYSYRNDSARLEFTNYFDPPSTHNFALRSRVLNADKHEADVMDHNVLDPEVPDDNEPGPNEQDANEPEVNVAAPPLQPSPPGSAMMSPLPYCLEVL